MNRQLKQLSKCVKSRQKVLLLLFFSVVLLVTAFLLMTQNNNWVEQQFRLQEKYVQEKQALERLTLFIKTGEAAIRGYALSGDSRFIDSFDPAIDSIRSILLEN